MGRRVWQAGCGRTWMNRMGREWAEEAKGEMAIRVWRTECCVARTAGICDSRLPPFGTSSSAAMAMVCSGHASYSQLITSLTSNLLYASKTRSPIGKIIILIRILRLGQMGDARETPWRHHLGVLSQLELWQGCAGIVRGRGGCRSGMLSGESVGGRKLGTKVGMEARDGWNERGEAGCARSGMSSTVVRLLYST